MQDSGQENETEDKKTVLGEARARFKLAQEAEQTIREKALEAVKFRAGEQWPQAIKNNRAKEQRPCLVINRMPQFIRQITNDNRQNRPSIKVSPVDSKGDVEIAKVYQGLIRHIENNSNADVAYDTAFENAAISGFGYFRVITEYCDPMSFDQEILIKRILDPFRVSVDPFYREADGSDMKWAFIDEDMDQDEYKREFPDSELAQANNWDSLGHTTDSWVSANSVRIAEYFSKEYEEVEIVQLQDGSSVRKSDLPEGFDESLIARKRKTTVCKVMWRKINGMEVLEETEWAGTYIPVIPVLGDELIVDGKRVLEGVITHAMDSQRAYNFWVSAETEAIALAPKAPFIVAEGQIEGYKHLWNQANRASQAYLPYKPTSVGGKPVPPPQRNNFEAPVMAITNARAQAADDMKSTTGIYDSALGNQSNEKSGIAIQRRNQQSQISNFHLTDNLSRSIRHMARMLIELIPKIYDTARVVRIIGEDDTEKMVAINQITKIQGEERGMYLDHGKYDATVSTGPSYQTKRQESVDAMLYLVQSYPEAAKVAGDLMVKNMDWPGAKEIAERLKKTLPPGMAESDDENEKPLPPQVQAQMQQMNQMIEQLTSELNAKSEEIKTKKLELESKERIEMRKLEVEAETTLAKIGSAEGIALLKEEIAQLDRQMRVMHSQMNVETNINPTVGGPAGPPMGV